MITFLVMFFTHLFSCLETLLSGMQLDGTKLIALPMESFSGINDLILYLYVYCSSDSITKASCKNASLRYPSWHAYQVYILQQIALHKLRRFLKLLVRHDRILTGLRVR